MSVCATACGTNPIGNYSSCEIELRSGGIERTWQLNCEKAIVTVTTPGSFNITDTSEWETEIAAGTLSISPVLLGSKALGSSSTITVSGKNSNFPLSKTETYNIKCYAGDLDGDTDYVFWNGYDEKGNSGSMQIGMVDCGDMVYILPRDSASVQGGDVKDESANEGATYFEYNVEYKTKLMVVPIYVAGLTAVLDAI